MESDLRSCLWRKIYRRLVHVQIDENKHWKADLADEEALLAVKHKKRDAVATQSRAIRTLRCRHCPLKAASGHGYRDGQVKRAELKSGCHGLGALSRGN